jgi:hypothetical protein
MDTSALFLLGLSGGTALLLSCIVLMTRGGSTSG